MRLPEVELLQELLCSASTFFGKLLTHSHGEAQDYPIKFPDIGKDAFEDFMSWLYSGASVLAAQNGENSGDVCKRLARLCALGQNYDIKGLLNDIIEAL